MMSMYSWDLLLTREDYHVARCMDIECHYGRVFRQNRR
ncbi:unnamed protein product [Brassica oleracea var. botrytis]